MDYTVDKVVSGSSEIGYLRFGEGKKTLVILPGLSVQSVLPSAAAIEKQYRVFRDGFTVYLFDRRSEPPEKYTVYDMASDTAEAMRKIGLGGVCLFGASQGGMIAQAIALDYPELVFKAALCSSACRIGPERASVIREWIRLAKKGKATELYLSFGEKIYPPGVFRQYRDAFPKMAESVSDSDLSRFITLAGGTFGFDVKERLREIRRPVLAVGDRTDAVLGADATDEIAEAFGDAPGFESFVYSGYGHAVYDTAPDFAERLYEFFIK